MITRYDGLGISSLLVYIIGGIGVFAGIILIIFVGESHIAGVGNGKSLGYLFVFVGAGLSILGVLLMRIVRNHVPRQIRKQSAKQAHL